MSDSYAALRGDVVAGLTGTRHEARSKIEEQIRAGHALRDVHGQTWNLEYENWDAHNRTLLASLFEDSGPVEEYTNISTGMPFIYSLSDGPRLAREAIRDTFERRLNRLSSFVSRLDLYEEPNNINGSMEPIEPTWIASLHPEVRRQSAQLVGDGHFTEAIRKSAQHLHNLVRDRAKQIEPEVADLDGVKLVGRIFGENPLIPLTPRQDKSERDEHDGLRFLFMGVMAALRNPRAHETDHWAERDLDLREVMEWLGLISALHRALDRAPKL